MVHIINNSASILATISIRYEGGRAASHEIDLNLLGRSIQGFARILAPCSNLLCTGTLIEPFDAPGISVVALPVGKHHCFEVLAMIRKMSTSIELWSGAFGAVLAVVVQYVLSRRDQDQMKYLNAALQKAMQNNQENYLALSNTVEKMMTVLDKLADSLRPAVREAMSPIDRACERIDLHADGARFMTLDPNHRFAAAQPDAHAAGKVSRHICVISEFDMASGACLVSVKEEGDRIPAVVLDPRFSLPNNPYVEAMAARYALPVLARLERDAHGIATRIVIFDTSEPGLDFVWR